MTKRNRVTDEAMECLCDRSLRRRIDQHLRHLIRKIVTSGSVRAPVFAQCFRAGEDFLCDHVNSASVFRQADPKRFRATLLKFLEILSRQVKTIRMIDAKAADCASAHQIQKKPVNGIENLWQFDPNRSQLIYVEKTAVIDFFSRDAPKRESIRLRVEQFIQRIETARIARLSVDLRQSFFDRLLHLRRFSTASLQTPFDDLLF